MQFAQDSCNPLRDAKRLRLQVDPSRNSQSVSVFFALLALLALLKPEYLCNQQYKTDSIEVGGIDKLCHTDSDERSMDESYYSEWIFGSGENQCAITDGTLSDRYID
jgi:hypothetical protein